MRVAATGGGGSSHPVGQRAGAPGDRQRAREAPARRASMAVSRRTSWRGVVRFARERPDPSTTRALTPSRGSGSRTTAAPAALVPRGRRTGAERLQQHLGDEVVGRDVGAGRQRAIGGEATARARRAAGGRVPAPPARAVTSRRRARSAREALRRRTWPGASGSGPCAAVRPRLKPGALSGPPRSESSASPSRRPPRSGRTATRRRSTPPVTARQRRRGHAAAASQRAQVVGRAERRVAAAAQVQVAVAGAGVVERAGAEHRGRAACPSAPKRSSAVDGRVELLDGGGDARAFGRARVERPPVSRSTTSAPDAGAGLAHLAARASAASRARAGAGGRGGRASDAARAPRRARRAAHGVAEPSRGRQVAPVAPFRLMPRNGWARSSARARRGTAAPRARRRRGAPRPRWCSAAAASPAPCTRSAPCGRSTCCRSTAPSTSSTSTSARAPARSSPR